MNKESMYENIVNETEILESTFYGKWWRGEWNFLKTHGLKFYFKLFKKKGRK